MLIFIKREGKDIRKAVHRKEHVVTYKWHAGKMILSEHPVRKESQSQNWLHKRYSNQLRRDTHSQLEKPSTSQSHARTQKRMDQDSRQEYHIPPSALTLEGIKETQNFDSSRGILMYEYYAVIWRSENRKPPFTSCPVL